MEEMEEWDEEREAAMEAEIEEITRQEAHDEETQEEIVEELDVRGGQEEGTPSETEVAAPTLTEEQRERIHRHKMEAIRILAGKEAEKEREAERKKAEDEKNRVEGGGKPVKLMAISMNVNGQVRTVRRKDGGGGEASEGLGEGGDLLTEATKGANAVMRMMVEEGCAMMVCTDTRLDKAGIKRFRKHAKGFGPYQVIGEQALTRGGRRAVRGRANNIQDRRPICRGGNAHDYNTWEGDGGAICGAGRRK